MIKIGDFAKLFNVSINTVRFYEEKGLLTPAYIDIYNGYRYFDENNISDMSKILLLKKLDFTLEDIRNYDDSKIKDIIKNYENEKSGTYSRHSRSSNNRFFHNYNPTK